MSILGKFFSGEPKVPESTQVERVYGAFRTAFIEMHGKAHKRMQEDPSLARFVDRYFDDAQIESKICSTGIQNMRLTVRNGKERTDGFAFGSSVAVNIQTVPASQEAALGWYGTEFKGFLGYIESVVAPVLVGKGFGALVHIAFGQDIQKKDWQVWTAIAVLNFADPKVVTNFLPDTLLTPQELNRYRTKINS